MLIALAGIGYEVYKFARPYWDVNGALDAFVAPAGWTSYDEQGSDFFDEEMMVDRHYASPDRPKRVCRELKRAFTAWAIDVDELSSPGEPVVCDFVGTAEDQSASGWVQPASAGSEIPPPSGARSIVHLTVSD